MKRINGWTYKTADNKYIIQNCGPLTWFLAEIDQEATVKHGFEVADENTKMYFNSYANAKNWLESYKVSA